VEVPMKILAFRWLQPALLGLILLFWAFAPAGWVDNPWSLVIATSLTTALIQALEWVNERHVGWRIDRREFLTDLGYVIFNTTVIAWATSTFADAPLTAAKQALGIATPWAMRMPFLLQVALVIFLIEYGQYWMHRAMHNTALWLTHAPHHHITQLNAMKGAVGNPLELFLISLSVVALFDLPLNAEFAALNILTLVSACAHSNVRYYPPRWYGFLFTTIENHSLHHSVAYADTRCNYANSLILIDRVFGTYREGESAIVGQDDRKRLSVWEQTIFPARPLIAWLREKRSAAG